MKQHDQAPSPPEGSVSPNGVVEIRSPSGYYAAVALRGSDGLFRISVFQWFYDEAVDEGCWSQISSDSITSITDTVESATKLATEELEKLRFATNFI